MLLIEARNKSIWLLTKFSVKKLYFWRLNALVFCCAADQYSEITGIFFKNPKSKRAPWTLMKPRLQLKMLLIQIILEWKVSMNEKNEVKAFF